MMRVTVEIGGGPEGTREIVNLGILNNGHPTTRDHPPHDDLRSYTVDLDGRTVADLDHRRGDGPVSLALAAMTTVDKLAVDMGLRWPGQSATEADGRLAKRIKADRSRQRDTSTPPS